MAKINAYQHPATGDDLGRAMKSFSNKGPVTAGMEMEVFLLTGTGGLPNADQHNRLYGSLRRELGDSVSVEPGAHMVELKSGVHQAARPLSDDLLAVFGRVQGHADNHGLKVQAGSDLPGFTAAQLTGNLVSPVDPETGAVRRAPTMVETCKRVGWGAVADWGCSTTSIHYTQSVQDADQLHRLSKIHAALAPVYYAAFENRERENGVHGGLRLRRQMGQRGLIAPAVFDAADGDDYVDRYVAATMKNQMITRLDAEGYDAALPRPMAFGELPREEQTVGNWLQAASTTWNFTKVKLIPDEEALKDKRVSLAHLLLEVRDFDVSRSGVPAIAGWLHAVGSSEERLAEAETRLEALGVPVVSDPKRAGVLSTRTLLAVETDPRTLETPFGHGFTARDAVRQVIVPMLHGAGNPAGSLDLWQDVAAARTPVFRAGQARAPQQYGSFIGHAAPAPALRGQRL